MHYKQNTVSLCPACKEGNLLPGRMEVNFRGKPYGICKRGKCGMGQTRPFPSRAQRTELCSSSNYRDTEKGKRFIAPVKWLVRALRRGRLKEIEKYSQKGFFLDIGCWRGLMLKAAREPGWKVYATEQNKDSAPPARGIMGIDVRTMDIRTAGFESGSFDVVFIRHVLEHLQDPSGVIEKCHDLLRPGGLLVIEAPNFSSLQARVYVSLGFHLDAPFHLRHFTLDSLRKPAKRPGFRIRKVSQFAMEFNPYGFLQGLLNMPGVSHNCIYNMPRADRPEPTTGKKNPLWDALLTILLVPIFLPASLVLSLVESILSMGGTVQLFALREKQ
jgi:SAM-dependent methyltransferase